MAQSANTYLEATHRHGTIKKMEDIRYTVLEMSNSNKIKCLAK